MRPLAAHDGRPDAQQRVRPDAEVPRPDARGPQVLGQRGRGRLAEDGCISYRRGTITILDRARLEANACTCYRVIREAIDATFPPAAKKA